MSPLAKTWQGTGPAPVRVRCVTLRNPCYLCTWTVVEPGPGLKCISELRYANALCSIRHFARQAEPLSLVTGGS